MVAWPLVEYRVLGPFEAHGEQGLVALPGRKPRALLVRLLLDPNRTVSVERMIDDLWGDDPPGTAPKMIQIGVSQLRKVLPEGTIRTSPPGYLVVASDDSIDLHRFQRLRAEGQALLEAGAYVDAAARLSDALELWRGQALGEFGEPFARLEAARLEELRLACVESRVEADLARGRHDELVAELEMLVAREPLRERLRRQLVLALYRSGRHGDSLAAYAAYRRELDETLGIDPSTEMRELERRVLRQDADLDLPQRSVPTAHPAPSQSTNAVRGFVLASRSGRQVRGRQRELQRLDTAFRAALDGAAQFIFVAGEAGIGKTTLVDAFTSAVTEAGSAAVAHGQCVEHRGVGEAYLPVLEAVSRLGRSPGSSDLVRVLTERAPAWLLQVPWLVDAEQLETIRQRALGTTRERMLRELPEALEALTALQPLILVLEDLHWSDVSTIDLLDALARRREAARLLVLGTYRPGDAAAGDHPVRSLVRELRIRGLGVELTVGPLTDDGLIELVADRFPGVSVPGALAPILASRTGGSPLFAEKLLDAWLDAGSLRQEAGGLELVAGEAELAAAVPDTIRELIEQMLNRVTPPDRELLEAASVVGTEFSAAAVAAAAGRDLDDVETRCDLLARDGAFVRRLGDEDWPDQTLASKYGFAHDLHREVLYGSLPAGRRTRVHARLGDRLERAYGDRASEVAVELALHFVRGREPLRAAHHLAAAAANALRRMAAREALDHLTTATKMLDGTPPGSERDTVELAVRQLLAPAHIAVEGWSSPAAEEALVSARSLAGALGRDDELARATYHLATMLEVRGEYEPAGALIQETLGDSTRALSPAPLVDAHELHACTLFHQGAFEPALAEAEQALTVEGGGLGSDEHSAYGEVPGITSHVWAALSLWFLGYPDRALVRASQAVELAELPEYAHALATAQTHRAIVHQCRLEPEEALTWAEAGLAHASLGGFTHRAAMAEIVRGWARVTLGEPGGVEEIRRGIASSNALGALMDNAYYLGLLADALAKLERWRDCLTTLDEACVEARSRGGFFWEAELLRLRAVALRALGESERANNALEESLTVARAQGARALELRASVDLARVAPARTDVVQRLRELVAQIPAGSELADHRAARVVLESVG